MFSRSLLQRKCDGRDVWMLVCLSLWDWRPSLQSHRQMKLLLKNDFQASVFKQCMTLSTQNAGKAMFLQGSIGINRECVFRPLSIRNCIASKTWDSRSAQMTWLPEWGHCISLHFPSLVNTFLGHTRSAHEKAGCGSVSESAGCHTVVT